MQDDLILEDNGNNNKTRLFLFDSKKEEMHKPIA
jgi:hypothetical protein